MSLQNVNIKWAAKVKTLPNKSDHLTPIQSTAKPKINP